uniref:HNH endonuclease n=1 Tax=Romanomermis culicivorax TaxID=13658 RepID=A0A915KPV3_ROMCU
MPKSGNEHRYKVWSNNLPIWAKGTKSFTTWELQRSRSDGSIYEGHHLATGAPEKVRHVVAGVKTDAGRVDSAHLPLVEAGNLVASNKTNKHG